MHSASGRSSSSSRGRPTRLANAWLTWTIWPRRSDTATRCADRVERVLELAPRSHHVVEQLHVLDGARELAAELVGAIEQVELAAGLDPHALEDDRAERAAAAAQRHRDRRDVARRRRQRSISARGAPHRDRPRAPADRRRRRATPRATCSGSDEACEHELTARGDRGSRPTCDPRRTAGWRRGRRCRVRPPDSASRTGWRRTRRCSSRRSRSVSSRAGADGAADGRHERIGGRHGVRGVSGQLRRSGIADGEQAQPLAGLGQRRKQRVRHADGGREVGKPAARGRGRASARSVQTCARATRCRQVRAPTAQPAARQVQPGRDVQRAPLRGLYSNSTEHPPPVDSSAYRCRCGSRSIARDPAANSDIRDESGRAGLRHLLMENVGGCVDVNCKAIAGCSR